MPWESVLLAGLITIGTYLVFGLTGFGSTVLALPLLAHFMPLKFAVPLLLLLDLVAAVVLSSRVGTGVRMDELGRILPPLIVGILLGLTLLINLPEAPLLAALGLFLLAFSTYGLVRRGGPLRLARAWSAPIGLAGGALSALFGSGGALVALYIAARLDSKSEVRATAAAAVLLNTSIRVVLFGAMGMLTQDHLLSTALLLVPSVLGGIYLGYRLHAVVATRVVLKAIHGVLAIAGLSLLVRVLGS